MDNVQFGLLISYTLCTTSHVLRRTVPINLLYHACMLQRSTCINVPCVSLFVASSLVCEKKKVIYVWLLLILLLVHRALLILTRALFWEDTCQFAIDECQFFLMETNNQRTCAPEPPCMPTALFLSYIHCYSATSISLPLMFRIFSLVTNLLTTENGYLFILLLSSSYLPHFL